VTNPGAPEAAPSARMSARLWPVLLAVTVVACGLWVTRRVFALDAFFDGSTDSFAVFFGAICALFVWQIALAWSQGRALTCTDEERRGVNTLTVCVNVPCYNEEPALLHRALGGIFAQTRMPDRVEVVDDGSAADYSDVREYWMEHAPADTVFTWRRTLNRGKRHAQMETFSRASEDVFVTVDSDTVLDARAIEEGLVPFADPTVMAVGGLVLGLNKRRSFLTRIEDLVFTSMQMTVRSAYSQLGSVVVNSGALALYRSQVVHDHHEAYLSETIMGRPVGFSDDSLLTLYAASAGRTVQQLSAVAFTHWPENVSHHMRQQVRWMRGSALRTFWRARYLPLNRPAFWLNVVGFAQFVAITVALVYIFAQPHLLLASGGQAVAMMVGLAYLALLRSVLVWRSDETIIQRLATYALAPVGMLWLIIIARGIRLYGMVTFAKTEWGTRESIESAPVPSGS
jgi:hyaluronan synthase